MLLVLSFPHPTRQQPPGSELNHALVIAWSVHYISSLTSLNKMTSTEDIVPGRMTQTYRVRGH